MLERRIAVYVPSTINGNQPAPQTLIDQILVETKSTMAKLFGGFTAINANGGYFSEEHGLIEEQITMVIAFATEADYQTKQAEVFALAQSIARRMTQEVVAVELPYGLKFINA